MTNDKELNAKFLELLINKAVEDKFRTIAPPQPKLPDEGQALDVIVNHLNTCRDGNFQVNNKLEEIANTLFQECPECSKIVRKDRSIDRSVETSPLLGGFESHIQRFQRLLGKIRTVQIDLLAHVKILLNLFAILARQN